MFPILFLTLSTALSSSAAESGRAVVGADDPQAAKSTEGPPQSTAETEQSRVGLGARAGAGALLILPGPYASLHVRIRLTDWIAVEPHAGFFVGVFPMIGIAVPQIGLPLLLTRDPKDCVSPQIGIGPVLSQWIIFGHVGEFPGATSIGGELFLRGTTRVAPRLDLFAEARGQLHFADQDAGVIAGPLLLASVGAHFDL
jgi:hypothetical protein